MFLLVNSINVSKKLVSILQKLFKEAEGTFSKLLYEISITLIPKSDKDITRKESEAPNAL